MVNIENVSLSPVRTALSNFGSNLKRIIPNKIVNNNQNHDTGDKLQRSNYEPIPAEQRLEAAIIKYNESNKERLVAEINRSGEIDSVYDKVLLEYGAYKNPDLKGLTFTPVSENTVTTKYQGKPVEIVFNVFEDGKDQQEINFEDGSQIKYITFYKSGKMDINGEEFEMPEGTIVEIKSANGRTFSQLIQTPDMQRKVIEMPEGLDEAKQALTTYNPVQNSEAAVMPTPEYMLNLLGKADSARTLLEFSKMNPSRTSADEIAYLEKSIAEGKLPENTSITGVNKDGGKILTIQGNNCKYEVCGSEMRVIDNNGETKIIARYESGRETQGLWVVSYDNGKPVSASRYASWNLDKPVSTVNYTYNNDNTVTVESIDLNGNKNTVKQAFSEDFCLRIDRELKFVSSDSQHLGLIFENQTPYTTS